MDGAFLLNDKNRQKFMDLIYDFIWGKTEFGICGLYECETDSEHVHRVSIFICDKDHPQNDLRWVDEMKKYLEAHFPDDGPVPEIGGKFAHSEKEKC
jgi:hypothetical protein